MKKIGVIGLWHLGCVLCAAWTKLGHEVVGYDSDAKRVDNLKKGAPPLFEPGLAESIKSALDQGSISFSTSIDSLSDCDFVFLSYDTPVLDDDSSDTSILRNAVKEAGRVMKDGSILIVSSQSPVGFCSDMRKVLKGKKENLELVYSPENLRLGEAIECYLNPDRIILGTADAAAESACSELFAEVKAEILNMSLESAEMVKHGINAFLSTSIVFANQLADLCEISDARIDDVVRGMKTDGRIGEKAYLSPGIGFSGGTLGRDLRVLSALNRDTDGYAGLFCRIHEYNANRKSVIIKRVENVLGNMSQKRIFVLGATYKPGTSTLRRSLPLEIVQLLIDRGCEVSVYDPEADYSELEEHDFNFAIADNPKDGAAGRDMILLLTDWPEFRGYDWKEMGESMRRKVVFDARNFLDEKKIKGCGFEYYSVGRS